MELEKSLGEFNFFIPATFEKGKSDKELMRIKGIASSVAEDSDGETLHPSGFELDYLLTKGFFNWDHQSKKTAAAIIGEPDFAKIVNNGKQLYVEGYLYADSEEAKATYKLAQVLEKNSKTRRLGFSIEGQVIERGCGPQYLDDKNTILNPSFDPVLWAIVKRARITSIAITPMPKNPNTLLEVMKGQVAEPLQVCEYDCDITKAIEEIDLEKGGEGSKGGKVIGHTRSGKPIYNTTNHSEHKSFNYADHFDSRILHQTKALEIADKYGNKAVSTGRGDTSKVDIAKMKKNNFEDFDNFRHHIRESEKHQNKASKKLEGKDYIERTRNAEEAEAGSEHSHNPGWHGLKAHMYSSHFSDPKYAHSNVEKAMSAEGMSADGLIAEHIEGTKNPNKTPLKGGEGATTCPKCDHDQLIEGTCLECGYKEPVASYLKKSEIYNLIADNYTTDPVVAAKIYSLIQSTNQKLFDMAKGTQGISLEAVKTAFDFLNKGEEAQMNFGKEKQAEAAKEGDNDQDDDDIEKAIEMCKSLMEKGMSDEASLMGEMKKSGFSDVTAQSAVTSCIEDASANKDGGTVAVLQKGQEAEQLLPGVDFEGLMKGMSNELKGYIDRKFQATGTLLQAAHEENALLKGEIDNLTTQITEWSKTPAPRKSITSTHVERFAKSQEDNLVNTDPNTYELSKGEDVARLSDVVYNKALLATQNGRPDQKLEKIVAGLEITKSISPDSIGYLGAMGIKVIR